jgi:hemoglobin
MSSFANRLRIAVVMLAVALVVPAIALAGDTMDAAKTNTNTNTNAGSKEKSLYVRLGGKKGVTAVVNDFVSRLKADTRVSSFFAATTSDPARLAKFKQHFFEKICQAAGGPCKYTGKDMKSAHSGMKITSDNFNAVVEDLTGALDKYKVGDNEKNQLLGVLSPMKADIAGSDD